MPKGRESRWQMAIQPLTGACFSIFANVVFIFATGVKKQHFAAFVKAIFRRAKNALSDCRGVLD